MQISSEPSGHPMASIRTRPRSDGSEAHQVTWRLGGTRTGPPQAETFSSIIRARDFAAKVEKAGGQWPAGWVKGRGFVRPEPAGECQLTVVALLEAYITQLVDVEVFTRSHYRSMAKTLAKAVVPHPDTGIDYRPFGRLARDVTEDDVRAWVNGWKRAPKTKRNYLYGLIGPAFRWAVRRRMLAESPCQDVRVSAKGKSLFDSEGISFLDEDQFALLLSAAPAYGHPLLRAAVGTGARYSELTALIVSDFSPRLRRLHVQRAWKRGVDPDAPTILGTMRGYHLGDPKTPASNRRISLAAKVVAEFTAACKGKAPGDLIFPGPNGRPWHNGDFHEDYWDPTIAKAVKLGLPTGVRFHDLRHTHVAWLISGGTPLTVVQQRLGHTTITTTNDVYGGLLTQANAAADAAIDNALGGGKIELKVVR